MTLDLAKALMLLYLAAEKITARRRLEETCGYPPEYGDDELLLSKIGEFLEAQGHTADELVSFLKEKLSG